MSITNWLIVNHRKHVIGIFLDNYQENKLHNRDTNQSRRLNYITHAGGARS
jgi:hypothetical protein